MQIINVDLIPGKVMPILHASQFDVGRSLGVKLYNGGAVFELSGAETLTAAVRKPDGNIVTETLTNAGGSLVEIITTEQMTACAGGSLCEIKIEDSGDVIGTANFVLEVEEDPLDGGIASQSEIDNLATQVAGLVATEVEDQYDSANVIFDDEPTEGHGVGYAVTSEGVKNAIDAITPAASSVSYDNTGSGMTATNAQDAIDELDTDVGDLSSLTTTDKSSLVGAVNEVDGKANSNATEIAGKANRASTPWGTSITLPVDRNQFIVLASTELYVVWFAATNTVRVRNVGANTTEDGTDSVTMGSITFSRSGLRLTVTSSSSNAITIIG